VFFAVHGPMLDHSEDPRSPSTSGCLAAIYSGRRLKLRVSYTRLTWGLAKRCAEIQQLLGSAHIASSPVRTESPLQGISGYSRTGLSSYRLTASRRRQPRQRGEPRHHAVFGFTSESLDVRNASLQALPETTTEISISTMFSHEIRASGCKQTRSF
jgi:hypothetical protein